MNIDFRKSFEKDLANIQDSSLLQRIKIAIEEVESADNIGNVRNVKKLKADGTYYRIRVGDYRIGISLESETAIFVRVLHRKDMYRYFP
ncbi:type II toxin-antitoxin system RelE/ParE family toxin [Microcoleus sp. FACHB-831]|uniref:type II toxin-antitoxin system RelE family toxin n=1 Tax=Microcoleus sp. FACHB-831 TaxID=2692827 RepID=UPI0016881A20|nr:type II toxin-antitoxin system RelE/ParE family toxin [Microcoleus sp. FACHB-831]MBD1921380.1 type II toxin-antitoxin system RelE/ParE family toxin [Microcoleus sp. FACHB-831]